MSDQRAARGQRHLDFASAGLAELAGGDFCARSRIEDVHAASPITAAAKGAGMVVVRRVREAIKPKSALGGLIADLTRTREELESENAPLRQQVILLSRGVKTPKINAFDRVVLVLASARTATCATPFWWSSRTRCFAGIAEGFDCSGLISRESESSRSRRSPRRRSR